MKEKILGTIYYSENGSPPPGLRFRLTIKLLFFSGTAI